MSSAITTAITDKLVDHVEEYVKKELASHDASHDWWHVYRVAQNALHLGKLESLSQDSLCIVRLAALLHDVKDWKYGGTQQESESVITVGTNAEADVHLDGNMWPPKRRCPSNTFASCLVCAYADCIPSQDLLRSQNVHQSVIDQVLAIIRTVGFKEELASGPRPELSIEAAVVQDADRYGAALHLVFQ